MSDLVVIGREPRVPQAAIERPTFVVAGTGGKRIRMFVKTREVHEKTGEVTIKDGFREVVLAGESLANALRARRLRKPLIAGDPVLNGAEIVCYVQDKTAEWLRRGAVDLGPLAVIVGEEPVKTVHGKSVPEQQDEANRAEQQRIADEKNAGYFSGVVGPARK